MKLQVTKVSNMLNYVSLAKRGVRKKGNRGIAAFQKLSRPSVRLSEVWRHRKCSTKVRLDCTGVEVGIARSGSGYAI